MLHGFSPGLISASVTAPASVTFIASPIDASGLTTYTFSSVAIGVVGASDAVFVVVNGENISSGTINSVTIDGETMTEIVSIGSLGAGESGRKSAIYAIKSSTLATSSDVVVTWSSTASRCGIGAYVGENISNITAFDTLSVNSGDPMTGNINVESGGIIIAGARDNSTSTYTWTNLTEDYDVTVEGNAHMTGASLNSSTTQTVTVTCDPSAAAQLQTMAVASFK